MNKFLFVLSSLIVCTLSTATANNFINTIISPYSGSDSILIVNPFATQNNYVVSNVTLEYPDTVLDILSYDQTGNTMLIYGKKGSYDSLILIDYTSGSFKEISTVNDILSYSSTPQKLVFLNNTAYLPVKEISDDNQHVQILETNFNERTTNFIQLNSPSFTSKVDQNLIQGYDPINNKLYVGYGTLYNGVNLIEVALNTDNSSDSDSGSPNQVLYDNIEGFTTFEYIFTDNSGQVYIVSRDSQFNVIICKFDKDTKQCPTIFNYGQDLNNYAFQPYFLSQDRNTFILIGPPTDDNTESLQLVQFEVNNNMTYSHSPLFPNYWNNTNAIESVAISI